MRRWMLLLSVALFVTLLFPAAPGSANTSELSCTVTTDGSSVVVSWNDIGARGYDVVSDGAWASRIWVSSGTSYTDRTPATESYRIVAFGNGTDWTEATCDVPDDVGEATFSCTVVGAPGGVRVSWTDIGANGYDVRDIDDGSQRWIAGSTSYLDLSPSSNYRITAFGNGTDFTRANCNLLTGDQPGAPFSCSVVHDGATAVVSWSDIGARSSTVVNLDTGVRSWVGTTVSGSAPEDLTRFNDSSLGTSYKVISWGNGTDWTEATCDLADAG